MHNLSEKESTLNGKIFAHGGSKFYTLKVDQFSEGRQKSFDGVASLLSVLFSLKIPFYDIQLNLTTVV